MRLEIQFRHMDRSEALEDTVTSKVMSAMDGFLHRHDAHVLVWLVSDLNRTNRGTGVFKCEIEVRTSKKKDIFISKTDADMHVAIGDAVDKLQDLLTDVSKREVDYRANLPRESKEATQISNQMAPEELTGQA